MMKRLLAILLASCMVVVLAACGKSNEEVSSATPEPSATEKETATPDPEPQETGDDSEPMITPMHDEGTSSEELGNGFSKAELLKLGKEIHVENVVNFSFEKAYWSKEIRPEHPQGSYNYWEGKDGYQYLVIEGTIENLQEERISLEALIGNALPYLMLASCEGKYYLAKMNARTENEDNLLKDIEPKEKLGVYAFAMLPEELSEKNQPVDLLLGFSDFQETVYSDMGWERIDWDLCDNLYKMHFDKISKK